ncbi:MAG: hypothetical protein IJH39_09235 [Clostridia bacterium]|nr:hypothetical protein [Clostridia bacterium]
MKKTLKVLAIVAILVAALFALTGCEKKKSNSIVGSWKSEQGDYIYTFKEDGTGDYAVYSTKMNFTYKTENEKIAITYDGSTAAFETEYNINGDTLNIKDSFGKDTLYKRQK